MSSEKLEQNNEKLGLLAYTIAIVVGTIGAATAALATISDRFNRDLRVTKALSHINKPYIDDLERYNSEFFSNKIDALTLCEKTGARKVEHASTLAKELKNRGFPSGFEGLRLRYMQMSPKSKNAMRLNAGITAAIGFCGALTLFNNIHMNRQLEKLTSAKSEGCER